MSAATSVAVDDALAADPFTSLAVHYGMLLGVPDFQTMLANARGKLRLHQAWLHGPGVVWGFDVHVEAERLELQVRPGLAVDGLGREVALGVEHCVNLLEWLRVHAAEVGVADPGAKTVTFDAELVVRHAACLSRPVPAIASACDGSSDETAWSRVLETSELELRAVTIPPEPPAEPAATHPRERWFASTRTVVRGDARSLPGEPTPRTWNEALRIAAGRDTTSLAPPAFHPEHASSTALFPEDPPSEVVVAVLRGVKLRTKADGTRVLEIATVDRGARHSHLPTWALQELLGELVDQVHGPMLVSSVEGTALTVELGADVVEGTLIPGLTLHRFDAAAPSPSWAPVDLTAAGAVTYSAAGTSRPDAPASVAIELPTAPSDDVSYRLVLAGTGPTPIVRLADRRPVPFADGRDAVVSIP